MPIMASARPTADVSATSTGDWPVIPSDWPLIASLCPVNVLIGSWVASGDTMALKTILEPSSCNSVVIEPLGYFSLKARMRSFTMTYSFPRIEIVFSLVIGVGYNFSLLLARLAGCPTIPCLLSLARRCLRDCLRRDCRLCLWHR